MSVRRIVPDLHAEHVAEMARQMVVERFGEQAYTQGYKVITSLRAAEQQAAPEQTGPHGGDQRARRVGVVGGLDVDDLVEERVERRRGDRPHPDARPVARVLLDVELEVAAATAVLARLVRRPARLERGPQQRVDAVDGVEVPEILGRRGPRRAPGSGRG